MSGTDVSVGRSQFQAEHVVSLVDRHSMTPVMPSARFWFFVVGCVTFAPTSKLPVEIGFKKKNALGISRATLYRKLKQLRS